MPKSNISKNQNMEIFNEARTILSKVLKIDAKEITLESNLQDDLGIDSVDFWDILAAFEKKFDVRIPLGEATSLKTVSELLEKLQEKIEGAVLPKAGAGKSSSDSSPLSKRRKSRRLK